MSRFKEAANWLESLQTFGIKPGLERMQCVLEKLDNPQHRLKFVHIAGTNGKGSTVQYIASVLKAAGYRVGTFTSPGLSLRDRIRCDGEDISEQDFVDLIEQIKPLQAEMETSPLGPLTEFEVTTVLAILYFSSIAYPDIVLWEAGLGGRLDSTNVVVPLISVITNIGFDHMHILGHRLEQIAAEKAGIIKNGFPVVTAEENPAALGVISEVAREKKAPLYQLGKDFFVERATDRWDVWQETFHFQGPFRTFEHLSIPLVGAHQVKNAGLAVMVLELLRQYYALQFEPEELQRGLSQAAWPGRFEIIEKHPYLILDGAHNIDGMKGLIHTLRERFPGEKPSVLFSALADKDVKGMIELLAPECRKVIVTKTDHPRAQQPSDMEMWFRDANPDLLLEPIPDWREALRHWVSGRDRETVLLATGSLYFISDLRKALAK